MALYFVTGSAGFIRSGEVKHSHASMEKASLLLNYTVQIHFKEGLRKLINLI